MSDHLTPTLLSSLQKVFSLLVSSQRPKYTDLRLCPMKLFLLVQMAEYRISIYGRKQSEWDQLASWIVNNELYSTNVVWLIQVGLLFRIYVLVLFLSASNIWIFCFRLGSGCYWSKSMSVLYFDLMCQHFYITLVEPYINRYPKLWDICADTL